jgi:DNA-binding NarL/FixJ family response regulator
MNFQVAGMRIADTHCEPDVMLRCLIIDDSRLFQDAARSLLELGGISVVGVASNGAEAIQQVAELRPDIMLLDVDLGGESGFDLARRLHRETDPPRPPVILISTHREADYADLIEASPVVGFLPKTTLSARAIHGLLEDWRAGEPDPGSAAGLSGTPGR